MKTLLLLLTISVMLSACNTVQGLGRDIQHGGEKLEKAATK